MAGSYPTTFDAASRVLNGATGEVLLSSALGRLMLSIGLTHAAAVLAPYILGAMDTAYLCLGGPTPSRVPDYEGVFFLNLDGSVSLIMSIPEFSLKEEIHFREHLTSWGEFVPAAAVLPPRRMDVA